MTSLLPAPTISLLTEALAPAGLATSDARAALLQGIHQGYALSLPNAGNDLDQVRSDLAAMNQVAKLDNGQVPLRIWLENAAGRLKLSGRTEAMLFQRALAELNTGNLSGLRPDDEVTSLPAPTAPESFAGRAEETRRLAAALQRPGASATAAIQGTGGMGKTTLARQLAHDLASQFAGGVLWLEIGRGPAAASQALDAETARQTQRAGALIKIARALRVDLSLMPGPDEQLALVRDTLARRGRLLAVVDDLWDVDLGRWLLKEVLPADRAVLFTSRNLGLCRALAPAVVSLEPMEAGTGALELLSQHLGEPLDGFEDAAQQLVVLLEGHPLALALAARKCLEGPRELPRLVQRLKQKPLLDILKLPGVEGPNTSVKASLALSYSDLTDDQQWRFRCLGIFAPGPIDLPALASVWDDASADEAEAAIEDVLRPRGLLEWVEQAATDVGEIPIYRQHSLLRSYALAMLEQSGEQAQSAVRHAAWYSQAMVRAKEGQRSYQMLPALPQVRKALAWALGNDLALAQDLVDSTFDLMTRFRQPLSWSLVNDQVLAQGLVGSTFELVTGYDLTYEHLTWCQEVLKVARSRSEKNDVASALFSLGNTLSRVAALPTEDRRQRLDDALAAYDEALDFYPLETTPLAYANTQNKRANILSELATLPSEDHHQGSTTPSPSTTRSPDEEAK